MLGTVISPNALIVSAEEDQISNIETDEKFEVVNDTILFNKQKEISYIFDSNEGLVNYIETSGTSDDSNIISFLNNEWSTINFSWFSKAEVQELANDVRRAQNLGTWVTVAGTWIAKFPYVGATVSTIGALMQNHQQTIINAANNNQSLSVYNEEKVNWNGYGPRTRIRFIRHD